MKDGLLSEPPSSIIIIMIIIIIIIIMMFFLSFPSKTIGVSPTCLAGFSHVSESSIPTQPGMSPVKWTCLGAMPSSKRLLVRSSVARCLVENSKDGQMDRWGKS